MPGQGVTIDIESSIGGGFHVGLDGTEVHRAVVAHTGGHLHGVAGNGLIEVGIGHHIGNALLGIVGGIGSNTHMEVGVGDILLQGLVIGQIGIFLGLIRTSYLEMAVKLISTGSHEHGSECQYDILLFHCYQFLALLLNIYR